MSGGTISGNVSNYHGGGVAVGGATSAEAAIFSMSGGTISGNSVVGPDPGGAGVGLYLYSTFMMSGGAISSNTCSAGTGGYGGGLITHTSYFTKTGGTISGNTAGRGKSVSWIPASGNNRWIDADLTNTAVTIITIPGSSGNGYVGNGDTNNAPWL
jgi:hypothetical protein